MSKSFSDIVKLEGTHAGVNFSVFFILLGVLTQALAFKFSGGSELSLISGCLGIISVVLCSQRKISFYIFGFAQLITYVILCVNEKLYGEIAENAFYFVTMLFGLFHWIKHYNENEIAVETRKMTHLQNVWVFIATVFGTLMLYTGLLKTDDTQPLLDAVTTAPAFIAQILLIYRFKESWAYWLIIDFGAIFMWAIAGDWCMVLQYVFWTVNCIYGYYKWSD